ncbi:MAG: putative zinc-binding protein [Sphaerochaetaceae bacterium]|nr:putative zinc-binding protein [Sphaerochaetaceae bacterium]
MMGCSCSCSCSSDNEGGVTLIYACSGGSNTGLAADSVARTLSSRNVGAMTCLAAVGASLSGFIVSAGESGKNVLIDGCKVGCGARIFKERNLPFDHYLITDFGVVKGETPITAELTDSLADRISERIQ